LTCWSRLSGALLSWQNVTVAKAPNFVPRGANVLSYGARRTCTRPVQPAFDESHISHSAPLCRRRHRNELTITMVVRETLTTNEEDGMRKSLSVSPQTVIVAPGYDVPASEVEDLIAGRKRERANLVYQAIFKRLLRGEKDIETAAVAQNLWGNGGPLR